jgi:hypothetical protein
MSTQELHVLINDAVRMVQDMDSATRLVAINSGILDRSFVCPDARREATA